MGAVGSNQRSRGPAQTRRAITEALLDLLRESGKVPTAADIATRAGVSRRSVFVHFSDLDELYVEAGQRQAERLIELARQAAPDDKDIKDTHQQIFTALAQSATSLMTRGIYPAAAQS